MRATRTARHRFSIARRPTARRQGDRKCHDQKTRQVMRADKYRVKMKGERQHHHCVLRAGRKSNNDVSHPERQAGRYQQDEH